MDTAVLMVAAKQRPDDADDWIERQRADRGARCRYQRRRRADRLTITDRCSARVTADT